MNKFNKNLFLFLLLFSLIISPIVSLADISGTTTNGDAKIENPISVDNFNDFLKTLLIGVIKIGIPIIALAIIYSGFLFVAARGNEEKLKTAKNSLIYTAIGAAILLGSWAIAQLISETVLAL